MNTIWVVLIVTLGLIVIVWMLRDRITRIFFKSSYGEGGVDAAPPSHQLPPPSPSPPSPSPLPQYKSDSAKPQYSVDFSNNKFSGSGGTFRVTRDSFKATGNKIQGNRDFIFEDSQNNRSNDDDLNETDQDA